MSLVFEHAIARTVGAKQTLKAMKRNEVVQLYIAKDCDNAVSSPLLEYAKTSHIPVEMAYTMEELGRACRIKVRAAAVGLLKEIR
ncbi:ribosomal L7Ae/L30e/S12e/Gadd45 family protein [Megasphaera hutchinsoni]|uniref:50S ribosomal protein L7ae-like protein n=1 Tax=Megasphaera hutchinsoni TaxID=1588748 RepID=A0A2J8B9U7_9FIRM|nr:ribosomal L7Ae/L30e/S12e/Gadd45 family protein [Megasphaera genomosp. type_2]MUP59598.1 50S ribosomal protein L7ae-like protein [Veillonellaceae bacterium M2-4]PNH21538.1 50S ribosomal protein L7ae-like protein [Megasphaera genomosp. type_2]